MYKVKDLYQEHAGALDMTLLIGTNGLEREIKVPEAHRPGLALSGYLKYRAPKRILIMGKIELEFLNDLEPPLRVLRLQDLLSQETPAVIVARHYHPPQELGELCSKLQIPLFRSSMKTMTLLNKLTILLADAFAPTLGCHGTLVEVFGVGILIRGESSVGKSEAALGLVERGHRLISDDLVKVKRKEDGYLEGYGQELSKHHMEIRGIGIINVAHLYGAVCVRDKKSVDIVVNLETWRDEAVYDRAGLDEKMIRILDIDVPYHVLPVKPGRDVVLLLETIALNHRLKKMGYHSAQEFNDKLLKTISEKQKAREIL